MWPSLTRKVLRLHVGPQGLHGAVWRAAKLLAEANLPAPADGAPTVGVDALLASLAERTALRGARAEVEFADALVTLDLVDGEFADHSERQLRSIASACCIELLGADAGAQELRWQLQSDERHLLICALPRAAIGALTTALAAHDVTEQSVQPRLCASWNQHARQLGDGAAVLALASPAGTTIACLHDGAIVALGRFSSGAHGLIEALDAHVARLHASLGLDPSADGRYLLVADGIAPPQALQRWTLLPGAQSAVVAPGNTA